MKRWVLGAALLGLGLLAVPLVAIASAFVGIAPVEDGRELADGRVITVQDGYVACFLVQLEEGWALVDACQAADAGPIQQALAVQNAGLDDVRAVLLTHGHGDHIGGLAALTHADVYALAAEQPLLEGRAAYEGPVPSLMGAVDTGVRARALLDGEVLHLGGVDIEVFSVPGHTAGSAAYLVHGVLFVGDNASVTTAGGVRGAPWVFTDDTAQNIASLRALGAQVEAADWLVPAHTGPAPGLRALRAL